MKSPADRFPYQQFLSPRYWLTWFGLLLLWLVTRLPYTPAMTLGHALGYLLYLFPIPSKKIASINVQKCLPELSTQQQKLIVKKHFISLGKGLIEMFFCWWNLPRIRQRTSWEGLEKLVKLHENKQPVILLTCHFTTLEIGGTLINDHLPVAAMYREQSNLLFNALMIHARRQKLDKILHRNEIRQLSKYLRNSGIVWYAPDQNYNGKQSVFANFFGIPAATTSATSRLAQISNAVIVPFYQIRYTDPARYKIIIGDPLESLTANDATTNTEIINNAIETMIRLAPDQYLWSHRRFKNLPENYQPFYK